MEAMFGECNSLASIDLSKLNTEEVETMYGMFYSCSSLTSIDVSQFKTDSLSIK